jgi:cell division protein FtsL
MVVAVVSVSALLVRASFRMDVLEGRIAELKVAQEDLTRQAAEHSSPSRVSEWARSRGFVMPDGVVILTVSPRSEEART